MIETPTSIAVLGQVNAPYSIQMDTNTLAEALKRADVKKAQVGTFLMEVSSDLQQAFADEFKISNANLKATAKLFAEWSGHKISF